MTAATSLPAAPRSILIGEQWQIGVYRTPFERVALRTVGLQRFRLKEWHYVSFTTDEWFVAVGLVQLGYVANLFCYVFDRMQKGPAHEYGALSPLGRALTFAPSSVVGTTTWKGRGASVSITANEGWDLKLDIPVGAERLRGHAHIEAQDSLAMLHRLDPRPTPTRQQAGPPRDISNWGAVRFDSTRGSPPVTGLVRKRAASPNGGGPLRADSCVTAPRWA